MRNRDGQMQSAHSHLEGCMDLPAQDNTFQQDQFE